MRLMRRRIMQCNSLFYIICKTTSLRIRQHIRNCCLQNDVLCKKKEIRYTLMESLM